MCSSARRPGYSCPRRAAAIASRPPRSADARSRSCSTRSTRVRRASRSRSRCLIWMTYGEHRHLARAHDALGDATRDQVTDAGAAVRAHHDEIDLVILGELQDLVDGVADADERLDVRAVLGEPP